MWAVALIISMSLPLMREMTPKKNLKFSIRSNHHVVCTGHLKCPLTLIALLPPSPSSPMHHTSIPTINSFSGSTPTAPTDPLRPGGSFASLSLLPPKIWDSVWVSSPGLYWGQLSSLQPRAERAYRLAAGDDRGNGLHLTGRSIAALADEFKSLLGDAAEHGDFTEILHPNRSFVMYVLCRILSNVCC